MFAVIYIPNFHLQAALRLEPELRTRHVALIDDRVPKATIFQLTEAAANAGVTVGLTSTQAMARCRDIIIRTRSIAKEEAATETLLQCAYCFSPNLESTAAGICTMDLRGLPDWSADSPVRADAEERTRWANKISCPLSQLGFDANIGLAETPTLALQAAKHAASSPSLPEGRRGLGRGGLLFVENANEFIISLPIESLSPPSEILEVLRKWGIRTVGAFLALGKDKLAERLGAEAVELFDSVSAHEIRPLNLYIPSAIFEESIEFENPIETLEPLLFMLKRFVDQLSRRFEIIYLVAGELHLRIGLQSGQNYEHTFRVPAPTRDVETLFRMLHTHLENVRTEAPIISLTLAAKPCRAGNHQFGLFEVALRDPNQFHETLARLTGLLGPDRAGTPRLEQSHRPDAFKMETPDFDSERRVTTRREGAPTSDSARLLLKSEISNFKLKFAIGQPQSAIGPALRRFRPPIQATVEMRND
ncbi:MAG: Y-family DNA polymerase, partial [Limisphaerales bacterium]